MTIFICSFQNKAFAYIQDIATGPDTLGFPAKLFVLGVRSKEEYNLNIDVKGAYGSGVGNDSASVPEIDLHGFGGELSLNYRWNIFAVGAGYSLIQWSQSTKTSEVRNINLQGTMSGLNVSAGLDFAYWKIIGKYHLLSDYKFEKDTLKGDNNTYSGPEGSYSIAFYYRINLWSYLLFEHLKMTYSKSNSQEMAERSKLNFSAYLIGIGLEF